MIRLIFNNLFQVTRSTISALKDTKICKWILEKLPDREEIKEDVQEIISDLETEKDETVESAKILARVVTGKEVSHKEKEFAAQQSRDVLKIAGMGVVAVAPGGSLAVPVLVKAARKVDLEMLPSAFQDNQKTEKNAEMNSPINKNDK